MNEYMQFYEHLGREIGIAPDAGSPSIRFIHSGRSVLIHYDDRRKGFLIHVHVGYLSAFGRTEILSALLASNVLGADTAGGALDLDPRTGAAGISFFLDEAGLEPEQFTRFVRMAAEEASRHAARLKTMNAEQEDLARSRITESSSVRVDSASPA